MLTFETIKLLQGGIIDVINLAGNGKRWEPEVSEDCVQDDGENAGRDHPMGSMADLPVQLLTGPR